MTFLILNNDENILINKVGESIYYRSYPPKYQQKSNILGKSLYHDYSVGMDMEGKIHLVYKTTQNSILHLEGRENAFTTTTLLDDPENTYNITNLQLVSGKRSYLFYAAKNPYENTTDLIFHNFSDRDNSAPQALFSLVSLTTKYLCILFENYIYLLSCVNEDHHYELNLYQFDTLKNQWDPYETLVSSDYPITDFSFVPSTTSVHIAYVIEKFGHSTLYYGSTSHQDFQSLEIFATGQRIRPTLFFYDNVLWLSYITAQTLYCCFSRNNGQSFSKPQKSTLQNASMVDFTLLGKKQPHLRGDFFFGYLDHQPNIAILSQIDLHQLLFTSPINTELRELLMEPAPQPVPQVQQTNNQDQLKAENEQLRAMQETITQKYNELTEFTKDVQNEGKRWRKKYQNAIRELNALRGEKTEE